MTDSSLAIPDIDPMSPRFLAAAAFLAGYSNPGTRKGYASDLRIYFNWCDRSGIDPLTAKRIHVQLFVRYLEDERKYGPSGIQRTMTAVRCFYDNSVVDGYVNTSPCLKVKTPRVVYDPTTKTHLTRYELANLIRAAKEASPRDWAMVHLLSTIGMRIRAVCDVRIEDLSQTPDGYRVLRTVGKGNVASLKALPIPVAQAVDAAVGDRTEGHLLLRRDGSQMTRRSAGHRIDILAKKAGIDRHVYPHALRTTHVTLALKSGVDLFVVQAGVDHSDPRTTLRYNALGVEIHGQASHTLAAMLASS
jgi:integrase/recombinase XerD